MNKISVSARVLSLALVFFVAPPALAQQQGPAPVTSPTMAKVVAIRGDTVIFRTSTGLTVGVHVAHDVLSGLHIDIGTPARLIPLPQGHVRVELLTEQQPCTDSLQSSDSSCG